MWGGISFWFTSALAVSQLVLLLLMYVFKQKNIWYYVVATFVISAFGIWLNIGRGCNEAKAFFPWFYKIGLAYTFIMAIGGLYYRYERKADCWMRNGGVILTAMIYVALIAWSWIHSDFELNMLGVSGTCNICGFICLMSGTAVVVAVAKKIASVKWMEYIGKNSIVFYFFCGVFPAVVGSISCRFFLM